MTTVSEQWKSDSEGEIRDILATNLPVGGLEYPDPDAPCDTPAQAMAICADAIEAWADESEREANFIRRKYASDRMGDNSEGKALRENGYESFDEARAVAAKLRRDSGIEKPETADAKQDRLLAAHFASNAAEKERWDASYAKPHGKNTRRKIKRAAGL